MDAKGYVYTVIVWFTFGIASSILVGVRNNVFNGMFDDGIARLLTVVILIAFILVMTYVLLHVTDMIFQDKDLLVIGVLWVVLTVVFEFLFGSFILSSSWEFFAADFDVIQGGYWVLILFVQLLSPLAVDMVERW